MPVRLCLTERCPDPATYRGRCQRHAKERNTATHHNRQIYNSKRWQMLRRSVLFNHPLCIIEGCDEIALDVDHITPLEQGGDPWSRMNLQAMCHAHHAAKTKREMEATQ